LVNNRALLISSKRLCYTEFFDQGVSQSVFVLLQLAAEDSNGSWNGSGGLWN